MPVSLELWRWTSSVNFELIELLTPVKACKLSNWENPRAKKNHVEGRM